ncbi:MAG: glycosyltransferase [Candidatus Omnitrophica bacterium]|nr:glycosyltransferase [Candidatus Omnitrophota bacterium]
MKKEVSILIPTRFDSRYVIDLCLRSIRKYTEYPYQIIVGDAGIDEQTRQFLETQKDIRVVSCSDPIRPKDHLARVVDTPYFIILHDDVQIIRKGWLKRRVEIMERSPQIGAVGVLAYTYLYGWRRFFAFSVLNKRFFPLVLLVRKEMQDELDLFWGKIEGFDTGAIAYLQFKRQKKWKMVNYKFNNDIKHWGGMTWLMRKKICKEKTNLDLDKLVEERNEKIESIKNILLSKAY